MTTTRLFFAASTFAAVALTTAMVAEIGAAQATTGSQATKPSPTTTASPTTNAAQAMNASDGIYTKEQASRGLTIYDSSCASCHELSKFKGTEFANTWTDKPLTDLHTAVVSMPMDAPGSLKPQEYADILAYFLSINDYPTGKTELPGTEAAIKGIKLDAKKK